MQMSTTQPDYTWQTWHTRCGTDEKAEFALLPPRSCWGNCTFLKQQAPMAT